MTVKELITHLLNFDMDAEVMYHCVDENNNYAGEWLVNLDPLAFEQKNGGEIKREYACGSNLSPYYYEREILILRH